MEENDLVTLKTALDMLDVEADGDWTADGLARVDRVNEIVGVENQYTRADISQAAPKLNREDYDYEVKSASQDEPEEKQEAVQEPVVAEEVVQEPVVEPVFDPNRDVDPVMGMPMEKVIKCPKLLKRVLDACEKHHGEILVRMKALNRELEQVSAKSALANRYLVVLHPQKDIHRDRDNVNAYLAQCNKSRQERATAANKFIEAGTNVKDVIEQLSFQAPIDAAAMAAKSKRRGRQQVRVPAGLRAP